MIFRFFQRWATFFAIFAGLVTYRLVLPEDSAWWLNLAVVLPVTIVVYLMLHKDGVTTNRPKRRAKGPFSR